MKREAENAAAGLSAKWNDEKLERMLSKETMHRSHVNDTFDGMESPFTVLLLVEAREYSDLRNAVVERFLDEYKIIYIALNSGYGVVSKEFAKRGRKLDNVFFIDMVSIEAGAKPGQGQNVVYLNSPLDLTECILAAEKRLADTQGKVLLLMDSVSTLLVYDDVPAVEKFTHALLSKVNARNASAIVLSSGTGDHDRVTNTIGQFFEKTIKL